MSTSKTRRSSGITDERLKITALRGHGVALALSGSHRRFLRCSAVTSSGSKYVYILAFVVLIDSEDFVGCLAGNLRAASRLATRRYDAELRETGLRITQVAILAQVSRQGAPSISELAAELSSERSVIARDVAVLERDGLLSVAIDPKDRRARTIALTKIGRARLRSAGPAWRRAQHQMREALGQTLADDVLGISRAVVAALEEA